jgi:hypothetical protein
LVVTYGDHPARLQDGAITGQSGVHQGLPWGNLAAEEIMAAPAAFERHEENVSAGFRRRDGSARGSEVTLDRIMHTVQAEGD